jgi:hypothetical protein
VTRFGGRVACAILMMTQYTPAPAYNLHSEFSGAAFEDRSG